MSISFANTKQIAFFIEPCVVAGGKFSVDLNILFLVQDVHSASYRRPLRLDKRNGNDRRNSRHTELSF